MPYKTDEEGHVVLEDGKPVYIKEDGVETVVDFENLVTTVNQVNSESKARKEKIRELEKSFSRFDEIKDTPIEDIKKAIEVMTNLDQKELIKAGEMDQAVRQAVENTQSKYEPQIKSYEQRLNELSTAVAQKDSMIQHQVVSQALANSGFLNKISNTTADFRMAIFGNNFKVEEVNGQLKPVAYKADGERLYSPSNPAELCDTEEALQILWNKYPHKDMYSKIGNSGSGSTGNAGGGLANAYTRSEWGEKLRNASQMERAELARAMRDGKVKFKE